ncbi:MAG: glycosyltransferase [Firmicutes bacterium]|nr:glycosyltransferase [Bacillota bacterium]
MSDGLKYQMKALLVAYYFPPFGSPQSIRWIHLVKQLAASGWVFDVLTIQALPNRPDYDPELLSLINKEAVTFYRTYPGPIAVNKRYNSSPPNQQKVSSSLARLKWRPLIKRVYRAMVRPLLIPDDEVEWTPWAVRTGRDLLAKNHYDVVISSAPPMSTHLATLLMLKGKNTPWVADYGDPWVFNPMQKVPGWRITLDRQLETMVLRRISKMIVTTEACRQTYLQHYRWLVPEKVKVIPQGAGVSPAELNLPANNCPPDRMYLVHTGSFYEEGRDATPLLEAMALLKDLPIELILVGNLSDYYQKLIFSLGLSQQIICTGYVNHQKALGYQQKADLLIYFSNISPYQIPGKLFEYLSARRPILGITYHETDDGSELIKNYRRGIVVGRQPQRIAEEIRRLFQLWQTGDLSGHFNLEPVTDFHWDKLAERLHTVLLDAIRDFQAAPQRQISL